MAHYKAGLYDSKLTKNMLISFSYEMGLNFLFQNNLKDLNPFYKMDLELVFFFSSKQSQRSKIHLTRWI